MSSKQTDLSGVPVVSRVVKLTHTAGGYYLRVKVPTSDYYRVYESPSGTLTFVPLIPDKEEESI